MFHPRSQAPSSPLLCSFSTVVSPWNAPNRENIQQPKAQESLVDKPPPVLLSETTSGSVKSIKNKNKHHLRPLPKVEVPRARERKNRGPAASAPAQDAPAYKKARATSGRDNGGRHLGDSLTERVSPWKWWQQRSFDVQRGFLWWRRRPTERAASRGTRRV